MIILELVIAILLSIGVMFIVICALVGAVAIGEAWEALDEEKQKGESQRPTAKTGGL